jgi:rhamnopyranosyl-N-acetylglucosaminyl-diphospho-decaprenol beta-1,3/1,4-galactofuranosyltransferase
MTDGLAAAGGGSQSAPAPESPRVVAVIVTYNRRELLLESLAAVQVQHRQPDSVIVVDNASTDGTAAAVRGRFPAVRLALLDGNYGGAGGFAYGMAQALRDGADVIWAMDDDTIPEPDALAALLAARENYPGRPPAIVASAVLWTDGRPHPMNTPRAKPMVTAAERSAAAECGCVPIRSASFVSVLFDASECESRGLPRADFFLWNDDFEFTTRLLRGNIGLLCPASVVVHKTRTFGGTTVDPGERFFYEVRNKIWTLRANSLGPAERMLYAGATLRRWARAYAAAPDRRALRACFARGLVAGVRTRPRPNEQVLPGIGAGLATPRPAR